MDLYIKMKKLILFSLILLPTIKAQPGSCYTVPTATTTCPTAAGQNPNAKQFVAGVGSSLTSLNSATALLPVKNPNLVIMSIPPAQSIYRNSDTPCPSGSSTFVFSTATGNSVSKGINAYVDAILSNTNVNTIEYQFNPLWYTQAPEYTGSAVDPNPSCSTYQIAQDLLWLQHAENDGAYIELLPSPLPNTFTACGLNITPVNNITASQFINCEGPMVLAAVQHLNAHLTNPVKMLTSINEPNGYTPKITNTTFSPSDFSLIANTICSNVYAVENAIKCGPAYTAGDVNYLTNMTAAPGPHTTYVGFETFGGVNPASYYNTIKNFLAYCASNVTPAVLTCENLAGGDPPRDVPASSVSGSESLVYPGYGCAAQIWDTYGVNSQWYNTMYHYTGALNFNSFYREGDQGSAYFDNRGTTNCYDSTYAGSTAYAIENVNGGTSSATGWPFTGNNGTTLTKVTILGVTIH